MKTFKQFLEESKKTFKKVSLSFSDQIDQNKKQKDGSGSAKIESFYDFALKKWGSGSGTSVTSRNEAISKNKISIHAPLGRSGVKTTTITPFGNYYMVLVDDGAMNSKVRKTEYWI